MLKDHINRLLGSRDTVTTFEDGKLIISLTASRIEIPSMQFYMQGFSRDRFYCFSVILSNIIFNDVTPIRITGPCTETIGWIVPIQCLDNDDYYGEDFRDNWKKIYASAALDYLVNTDEGENFLFTKNLDGINAAPTVSSLFYDNTAVIVLGKTQLTRLRVSPEECALMLGEYGATTFEHISDKSHPTVFADEKVILRRLAMPLCSKTDLYLNIIRRVFFEESPSSKFLILYQVIEVIISELFEEHVKQIIADPSHSRNPWKLKEELASAAQELRRIKMLYSHLKGIEKSQFEHCQDLCHDFVKSVDPSSQTKKSDWAKELYMARNIVVHRQAYVDNERGVILGKICNSFLECMYEIITSYKGPEETIRASKVATADSDDSGKLTEHEAA